MNAIKRLNISLNLKGNFEKDGVEITEEAALKIWCEGNSNWSAGAYEIMTQILVENQKKIKMEKSSLQKEFERYMTHTKKLIDFYDKNFEVHEMPFGAPSPDGLYIAYEVAKEYLDKYNVQDI